MISNKKELGETRTQNGPPDEEAKSVVIKARGQIEVIMGPMFSGKSTELLRRLQRHKIAQKRVLLIKHQSDRRYQGSDTNVVTHDQLKVEATISANELDASMF